MRKKKRQLQRKRKVEKPTQYLAKSMRSHWKQADRKAPDQSSSQIRNALETHSLAFVLKAPHLGKTVVVPMVNEPDHWNTISGDRRTNNDENGNRLAHAKKNVRYVPLGLNTYRRFSDKHFEEAIRLRDTPRTLQEINDCLALVEQHTKTGGIFYNMAIHARTRFPGEKPWSPRWYRKYKSYQYVTQGMRCADSYFRCELKSKFDFSDLPSNERPDSQKDYEIGEDKIVLRAFNPSDRPTNWTEEDLANGGELYDKRCLQKKNPRRLYHDYFLLNKASRESKDSDTTRATEILFERQGRVDPSHLPKRVIHGLRVWFLRLF